jgi:uncharacterized membrane protein
VNKVAHFLVALMAWECGATTLAFVYTGQWKLAAYWLGATINTAVYYF